MVDRNDWVCLILNCSGINNGIFRTKAGKSDSQTWYFNGANDEQSYNEFIISQCVNSSETDNRIHFKIIHLKSKANSEETFDATEEICDFNQNNVAGTSGINKKRARTILETSYEDAT